MARPKGDPAAVRSMTIGVRVTDAEYALLQEKAAAMAMSPAQWLREAALILFLVVRASAMSLCPRITSIKPMPPTAIRSPVVTRHPSFPFNATMTF